MEPERRPARSRRRQPNPTWAGLSLLITSCFPTPQSFGPRDAATDAEPLRLDAAMIPAIQRIDVVDQRGIDWPLDSIPRSPRIHVETSTGIVIRSDSVLLISGERDDFTLGDFDSAPLRQATLERAISYRVEDDDTLIPLAPLERGARLWLAVAPWTRDFDGQKIPFFTQELAVSRDADSGARVLASWPPDGATNLGTDLREMALRFDGEIESYDDIALLDTASGQRLPIRAELVSCLAIGWPDVRCVSITRVDDVRLAAYRAYRIVAGGPGLVDRTGAAIPEFVSTFDTGSGVDTEPPVLRGELACQPDEAATALGCVFADDTTIALRVTASEPVRLEVSLDGQTQIVLASRGEAYFVFGGLEPNSEFDIHLAARDISGNPMGETARVRTLPELPRVAISEVRADPLGPEPDQEYVELYNGSSESVPLGGWSLSDRIDGTGDLLPAAELHPGERVLVVGDDFDPDRSEDGDRSVPPGVYLLRIGSSLASGGLSNGGEPLFLRDAEGRRISATPSLRGEEGSCLVRRSDDPRTALAERFTFEECTPGR